MTRDTLELLTKESTRLLCIQSDTLTEALTIKNFLNSSVGQKEKTIGVQEVKTWIGHLENERQKLEKLEMVLAVIGTMKAGKSTTINAIVGMEILPNRETAMTTLPTLIRNKRGQTQPILTINKVQPLLELSEKIAEKLRCLDSTAINQIDLQGLEDGKALIKQLIEQGSYQFATEYSGQKAIFEFLKNLNDVMRLAKDAIIDIEPPYHEYENSNDLPVIEVEFFHLKDNQDMAHGSLAILDTPGPNEFSKSDALQRVFKAQLEKASAILLVTDFTQMNTNADREVRDEIDSIESYLSKDRLAVIVNKYDQATENSMSKETLKHFVADKLMQGKVEITQVFPVSSRLAYLANKAKGHLAQNDKLPSHEQEPWVAAFGEKAFGGRWERMIGNIDEVKFSIEDIWKASLFEEPTEKVIKEAHANAAKISLKSAISQLDRSNAEFSNTLNIRSATLTTDIIRINEWMLGLQNDINGCAQVKKDVSLMTTGFLSQLEKDMEDVMANVHNNIHDVIKDFFKEGKLMEKKRQNQLLSKSLEVLDHNDLRNTTRSLISLFYPLGKIIKEQDENFRKKQEDRSRKLFDPNSPRITYSDASAANELIREVNTTISDIFNNADDQLKSVTNQLIQSTTEAISLKINDVVADTLEKAKAELNDNGVNVNFKLANIDLTIANVDTSALFNVGYQKSTETKYSMRDKDSLGSGVSRFFGGLFGKRDWGREEYSYQNTEHIVDLEKIKNQVLQQLEEQKKVVTNQTGHYLDNIFQPKIDSHLEGLVDYLERYRGVLGDGLKSHELDQLAKAELKKQLEKLSKAQVVIKNDIIENSKMVNAI